MNFIPILTVMAVLTCTSAVYSQSMPNMPARNPWLTDSVYPTSHFNPGATDSVLFAGLSKGKTLAREKDVKVVSNVMVSNPAIKKIGADTVAFASGTLGIRKLLLTGKALEDLSFTPYPGLEEMAKKASEKAIATLLSEVDAARRDKDDAKLLAAIGGIEKFGVNFETGINGVYNLFDKDGFHYCVFGGTQVLKSTDDNKVRSPVRVVKSANIARAMPSDAAKAVTRIIGLNMTYDGHLAAAPGALVVLDRDLVVKSFVTFSGEAVDNSIAIDEKNGIRRDLHQWVISPTGQDPRLPERFHCRCDASRAARSPEVRVESESPTVREGMDQPRGRQLGHHGPCCLSQDWAALLRP
jgi:hypothetical protein